MTAYEAMETIGEMLEESFWDREIWVGTWMREAARIVPEFLACASAGLLLQIA